MVSQTPRPTVPSVWSLRFWANLFAPFLTGGFVFLTGFRLQPGFAPGDDIKHYVSYANRVWVAISAALFKMYRRRHRCQLIACLSSLAPQNLEPQRL